MIIYKTSNEDLYKEVLEDRERLHKEAEEALEANKENAEEIEKYHGKDTKKPITNKALKAMHLSEALFENLNDDEVRNFNEDVYDAIARICELYTYDGVSDEDVQNAIKYFLDNYKNDENINYYLSWKKIEEPEEIPEFDGTRDMLDSLSLMGESINEELSQQGQKVLNELKKELGPELQKKVAFVIKDYANTTTPSNSDMDKKEKEIMKESIQYAIAKEQLEKYNEGRMPEAWNPKTYLEKLVMKSHITEEQAQMLKENYIHE